MAAHLEGKGVGVLDMAGLAQKGGAVFSHIRFAEKPEDIHAIRVAAGRADLVLGGDIVVAGTTQGAGRGRSTAPTEMVVNTAEFLPGEFTRNADFSLPTERLKRTIVGRCRRATRRISSTPRASRPRCSASRSAPTCSCVGYAYQLGAHAAVGGRDREGDRAQRRGGRDEQGGVPLGPPRRRRSRRASKTLAKPAAAIASDARHLSESFDEMVARRVEFLTAYQNAAYAARYRELGRQGEGGRGRARARQDAASPTRSRAICSS